MQEETSRGPTRRTPLGRLGRLARLGRYGVATLVATAVTELCFLAVYGGGLAGAQVAGGVAFLVGALPKFVLVRWWVWRRRGVPGLRSEVLPYALVVAATGICAGLLTGLAESAIRGNVGSRDAEVWAVGAALVGIMGLMFGVRYVLFDRLVFNRRSRPPRRG